MRFFCKLLACFMEPAPGTIQASIYIDNGYQKKCFWDREANWGQQKRSFGTIHVAEVSLLT